MQLCTDRLSLNQIGLSDIGNIHCLHSLPETDRFNTLGIPGSIEETKLLLQKWIALQNAAPRLSYIFAIRSKENEFIGLIAINIGDLIFKSAEVWYKLLPAHWGNGFATEALKMILQFGFSELQLHRIEGGCAVANTASVKVLQKAGMTKEGQKRKILRIRENWIDNYFFSILETEFKN